jgi:hypothetical protein
MAGGDAMTVLNWRPQWIRCQQWFIQANPLTWLSWAVLVLAIVGWGVLVPGLQDKVMRQRLALAQARAALLQTPTATAPEVPVSERNLRHFTDTLGDPRHMEQQLKTLFAIAESLELPISQADYKFQCEQGSRACTYRVQIPVKGGYAITRRFAESALQAIPFAALDEISFKRESISDDAVEARLRFSMYVTPPAGPMPDSQGDEP